MKQLFNPFTGKLDFAGDSTSPCILTTDPSQGIQSKIDSITDASSSKFYVIHVAPGVYVENIVMKKYVALVGEGNGPAAPLIIGTIQGTTSSPGEWILLNRINHMYTVTGDNQKALAGNIILNDYFCMVSCSGDYAFTGVEVDSTYYGTAVYSCYILINQTFNGSTKNITGVKQIGANNLNFLNISTVQINAIAASGTLNIVENASTGPVSNYNNILGVSNTRAGFAGTVNAINTTSTSTASRTYTGNTIVLTGSSGGTANAFNLTSGGTASITAANNNLTIAGFATKNAEYTGGSGDVIKSWLRSTDGNYGKAGSGLAIATPYDLTQSGFVQWGGSGSYYSYNPATRQFTLLRPCVGSVKSSPVSVAASQVVTCTDFAQNWIYGNADGTLSVASSPSFDSGIMLFSLYSDGTNYAVSKQTHPLAFPAAVSAFLHNSSGSTLKNDANGVITLLSGAGRTIKLVGDTVYYDHGLDTTVADSAGAAISFKMMYTGSSGDTFQGAAFTAIPGVRQNGTALSNIATGKYVNYRIGVYPSSNADDTTANQIAQYIIVPDSVEHSNPSSAADQITADSLAAFPSSAKFGLEVIMLGYATIQGDGAGGGTLTSVVPKKQTSGVNFSSGATTSAGIVTTDTTSFDKNLSGTDTSVQIALQTFDEFNALPNNTTNASASPDLTNKTAFASSASGTSAVFTFGTRGAIEFLVDVNTDGGMTIACDYKATTINAISDPSGLFLATDSGTGIYISKSANSAAVTIKNRTGATKTIGVLAVRSPVTATAWS